MDDFLILGGDKRLRYTARYLARRGFRVVTALTGGADDTEDIPAALTAAANVVLPVPAFRDGVFLTTPAAGAACLSARELLQQLHPGQRLFGGQLGSYLTDRLERMGVQARDYFLREEFTVANAIPTAEGALALAMEQLPVTMRGLPVLVTGYGHVGKVTARLFRAVGSRVTVAARSAGARAWADSEGFRTRGVEPGADLSRYGLVLNSVPVPVVDAFWLEQLCPDCLLIELASAPGGIDTSAAQRLGRRVIPAPGLPGRQAPRTAGEIIGETILTILNEIGE